jgi:hypothetical protein
MACGPKEYRAHAEACLRRARTVSNPILAEEFEKLAQSWFRLAKAAERDGLVRKGGPRSGMTTVPRLSSPRQGGLA